MSERLDSGTKKGATTWVPSVDISATSAGKTVQGGELRRQLSSQSLFMEEKVDQIEIDVEVLVVALGGCCH